MSLGALVSCGVGDGPLSGRFAVTIAFTNASALQTIPGPYTVAMDSLYIDITSGGGEDEQSIRRKLRPMDTLLTVPVSLRDGDATVSARVVSGSGALLFQGSTKGTVTSDGYTLTVDLRAQGPVLAVAPDTVRSRTSPAGALRSDTLRIYNRGIGGLSYSARFLAGSCGVRCTITPATSTVQGGTLILSQVVSLYGQSTDALLVVATGRDSLIIPMLVR